MDHAQNPFVTIWWKKGNMIFSEESSRAIYEMGNLELTELRQTSATIQCPSCLKHVPEGLNMCPCSVWLRTNQSTMDLIRATFASLKTPYCRTANNSVKREKCGHNQGQMDHAKAVDAKEERKDAATTPLYKADGKKNATYRASQVAIEWTETCIKYLDCISMIDNSHVAPNRQQRCESLLHMRSVDPIPQAGPLCAREQYKPSTHALVSLQQDHSQGVPEIPLHLRTRQHNTLDPTVQQHWERLSFNWQQHFSSSSSSTWSDSSTWWSSPHCDHQWKEWQDLLTDGGNSWCKTIGRTIQRVNNSCWSNGWSSSDFSTRSIKTSSIWQECLPRIFLGSSLIAGRIWEYRGIGKDGRIRHLSSKNQRERSIYITRRRRIDIPSSRWYSKIVRKGLWVPRTHSKAGTKRRERRSLWRTSRRTGESQPTESKDDAEARADFWSILADFIYRHHNETRVQLTLCRMKKHSPFHWNTLMWQGLLILIWTSCKGKTCWWLWECRFGQKFVGFLEKIHKIHSIERETSQRIYVVEREWENDKSSNVYETRSCLAWSMDQNWESRSEARKNGKKRETKTRKCSTRKSYKCEKKIGKAYGRSHTVQKRDSDWQQEAGCGPECSSQGSKDNLWLQGGIPIHQATSGISSPLKKHEDHTASKGSYFDDPLQFGSQFYSYATSDENTRCKRSSGQIMEEARDNPSMATGESQEQEGGDFRSTKRQKRKFTLVHWWTSASKTRTLKQKLQKYRGRVVLRGDIVTDDCGAYAVFYWTGLVCVPNDCRKSNGCFCKITRLRRTSSWCSIRVHSSKFWARSQSAQNPKVRMSRRMDASSTTQMARNQGQTLKIQWYLLNEICTDTHSQGCGRKDSWKKFYWNLVGKSTDLGMSVCSSNVSLCGWHQKWLERSRL